MSATNQTAVTAVSTVVDNGNKAEPMSRAERRATARAREQRVNQYEKNMRQKFHELRAKINSMDAYFLELASIVELDLAMVVGTGGDPVQVMRDRITELAKFERQHAAMVVSEEERIG